MKTVKKTLNVEQYIKENKQNCQNTGHVSQTKGVSSLLDLSNHGA